jgi:hypothetical protein
MLVGQQALFLAIPSRQLTGLRAWELSLSALSCRAFDPSDRQGVWRGLAAQEKDPLQPLTAPTLKKKHLKAG